MIALNHRGHCEMSRLRVISLALSPYSFEFRPYEWCLDVYRMIREFEPIRMREEHATGKSHDEALGKIDGKWKSGKGVGRSEGGRENCQAILAIDVRRFFLSSSGSSLMIFLV